MIKIKRGIYRHKEYFLTRHSNNIDWIAVKEWDDAQRANNGAETRGGIAYIHNTLRDLVAWIDRNEGIAA